jgi:capsular exopolysaccharide synthesis family protein
VSAPNAASGSRSGPGSGESGDELNLLEYWQILLDRRNVVFVCLGVVLVLGVLITFLSTPQYRAITVIQIERQGPDILTFKDVVGTDPAWNAYQDFYQTQYKILQSRSVLRIAAERLDLMNRPELVTRTGSPVGRLIKWARGLVSGPREEADQVEVAMAFIAGGLSIAPVRSSHLVEVRFTDRDPDLARDIANAVADSYQQFNLTSRYDTTNQASEFLTKEVARLESEIAALERRLQVYSTEKELLAFSDGTTDISEQALADLNARHVEARSRLAINQARYEALRNAPSDSLEEVLNNSLINHLKQQYAEIERRYTQMAERFKPGWPALTQLREELDQTQERLEIETANITRQVVEVAKSHYEQARAEMFNLEQQVEIQKREVQRVSRDAIDYASLKEEIHTRREVLKDLVARQSQTETSGQLRGTGASNIRVVDRAETPDRPVRPRKAINLVVSLVLGLGLGIGLAVVLHFVDNTIKSEQDLERYAPGLAVLGYVPLFHPLRVVDAEGRKTHEKEPKPDLASHDDPRSGFAEAFKNLRTSLLLASPDHPPRRVVVTSCEPGDGKSTVALNLGIVLTQMGRRVLLVDADLRRPRIQRVVESKNEVGLSSYLSGNATADRLIGATGVPGLDVITSGPIPPNPSELLDSPRLSDLFDELEQRERYDHIIVDSPPALLVADGIILSTKVDATILVVRAAATRRESCVQGVARLQRARARLVGTVLNALSDRPRYYYYRKEYRYEQQPPAESLAPAKRRRKAGQG